MLLIQHFATSPDAVALTESWLSKSDNNYLFYFDGYWVVLSTKRKREEEWEYLLRGFFIEKDKKKRKI